MSVATYIGFLLMCTLGGAIGRAIADEVIGEANTFLQSLGYLVIIAITWAVIVGVYFLFVHFAGYALSEIQGIYKYIGINN